MYGPPCCVSSARPGGNAPPLPPHSGKGGNQVPGHVRVPGQQGPGGTAEAVARCETGLGSRTEQNSQLRSGVGSESVFCACRTCRVSWQASESTLMLMRRQQTDRRSCVNWTVPRNSACPQVQRLTTTASPGGYLRTWHGLRVEWGADCGPVDCGSFPPVSLAAVQPCPSVGRGDHFGANKRAAVCCRRCREMMITIWGCCLPLTSWSTAKVQYRVGRPVL